MWRHPLLKALVAVYVVWGGWNWYVGRPVHCPDGILAPAEPRQGDVASVVPSRIGRWTLTPRATYRITARILGVERYHVDFLAPLVPEDQVVTLSGLLVDGKRDDGAWIKSSLSRTDTGAGACEVMLVQDLSVSP